MNGTILMEKTPKFVNVDNLPMGYFDEVSPHMQIVPSKINIKKLSQYLKEHNCNVCDITKEEAKYFMN